MVDAHAHALTRCRFSGCDAAGAPEVWALRQGTDPLATPEGARARMRQAARDALRARLAAAFAVPAAAIFISAQRGESPRAHWQADAQAGDAALVAPGVSISHDTGVSLIAWHGAGPVGVDVARPPADADAAELARMAQLYLEPNRPSALAHQAQAAMNIGAFMQRWACHEARLKCAGLGLVEWSDALAARLAGILAVAVELPPWAGDAAAAIAWRAPAAR